MKPKTKKTVFSLNYAPHYHEVIYKMLNDELNADFYFGKSKKLNIKKLDFSKLSNFKKEFKTIEFKVPLWYVGNVSLAFKNYDNIVLSGESRTLSNWIILLFSKLTGKKVYFWTHGWYGREGKIKAFIKKLFFKSGYKVFVYGNYAKGLMVKEGFNQAKLIPIYNSLDYDTQLNVRKRLHYTNIYINHFNNDYPVIVFIGRVKKRKKLEQLLDAMVLSQHIGNFYNLVIIGKQDTGYDFNSEIKSRGLEKYVWLYGGCFEEEKLGELIFNSNVCVSPGEVGLTAIHALMYGTPVISHNDFTFQGPEFEAIIEGYNGAFFKKDDINDLNKKIIEVIDARYPKEQCYEVVDQIWNPHNQIKIFKNELS